MNEVLYTVTTSTVSPITSSITSALSTFMPIGIGIMATFIGIAIVKRIIYTFL